MKCVFGCCVICCSTYYDFSLLRVKLQGWRFVEIARAQAPSRFPHNINNLADNRIPDCGETNELESRSQLGLVHEHCMT